VSHCIVWFNAAVSSLCYSVCVVTFCCWFAAVQGEIDERDFLLQDFGALASPRTLPGAADAAAALPHQAAAAAAAPGSAGGPGVLSSLAQAASHAAAAAAGGGGGGGGSHASQNPAKPPLAPGAGGAAGAARRPLSIGLQSPLPLMQLGQPGPATPISQAMGSVAWLKGAVKELALQPPASVQRYMDAAGADAGRVLSERVAAAAAAVFLGGAGGGAAAAAGAASRLGFPELQQGVAQERRDEVGGGVLPWTMALCWRCTASVIGVVLP
jgi:hypothetical protein